MGFDVSLVDRGSVIFVLDDYVRIGEAFFNVAHFEAEVGGDVAWFVGFLPQLGRHNVVMEKDRILLHGVLDAHNRRQHFIVNVDQPDCNLSGVRVPGRHGCHRMTGEQDLVPGQQPVAGEP